MPDVNQAIEWFEDVMGAVAPLTFGPFSDPVGTFMHDLLGVDPRGGDLADLRCFASGHSGGIELFSTTDAPETNIVCLGASAKNKKKRERRRERPEQTRKQPEGQRSNRAHHVLEPLDRLIDVRHRDADVVGADEAELAAAAGSPRQREVDKGAAAADEPWGRCNPQTAS